MAAFNIRGKEVIITSTDWIEILTSQYTKLSVGNTSVEITPTAITINGDVVINGNLDIENTLTASNLDEK